MTKKPPVENAVDELKELSAYCRGMGDALNNPTLNKAGEWLDDAAGNVCGQGIFGCEGGRECGSDHK